MKSERTVSITVLVVAALGTAVLVGWRSLAVETAYPLENAACAIRRGLFPRIAGLFYGSAAEAENVRLRRELASLAVLRGDVERLETENARLRRALDYAARAPETWTAARVLSSDGGAASVRNSVRVDKGSLAGVCAGAVVVVPEGLVGRVTSVSPHAAEVTLLTDPTVKVACETAAGGHGILSGGSEDLLLLRLMRGLGGSSLRSKVFTSGRGGVFPRGLEVGTLQFVTNGVRGVEGEVLPFVDFSTLEDVFIRRAK